MAESETRRFMRAKLLMTDAEIDEYESELIHQWLCGGLQREAAAVGMQPAAYQAMLNDIVDRHG